MKKTNRLLSIIMMMSAMFLTTSLLSQTRVALQGTAYMVSDDNSRVGLEVDGKLVVPKSYAQFSTTNGKTFIVETIGGKFKICKADGQFAFGGKEFYKASMTADIISIYETADSQPKFYDAATLSEKEVTAVDANFFARERGGYNPTLNQQDRATAEAKELSSQAGYGGFEIKTNERGRQELIADGKIVVSARTFEIISTLDQWKQSTCWFFILSDRVDGREVYGVYVLSVYMKDGKKYVEHQYTVPLEYSFIMKDTSGTMMLRCTTHSGAVRRLNWMGQVPGK